MIKTEQYWRETACSPSFVCSSCSRVFFRFSASLLSGLSSDLSPLACVSSFLCGCNDLVCYLATTLLCVCYLATTFLSMPVTWPLPFSLSASVTWPLPFSVSTNTSNKSTHTYIKNKQQKNTQTTHSMNKTDPSNNNNYKLSQPFHDQLKHSNNVNETPQIIPHTKSFGFSHHSFCCPFHQASAERPQWHSLPGALLPDSPPST